MFQRFVCFKFREGTPADAIQTHLNMFAALPGQIPEIVAYAGGRVVQDSEQPAQYDTAHYVTYATRADIDVYVHHPAHQAFIAANKPNWDNVLVVDSEV